jgi:hypothetical protein
MLASPFFRRRAQNDLLYCIEDAVTEFMVKRLAKAIDF